jgi:hypothetical protein
MQLLSVPGCPIAVFYIRLLAILSFAIGAASCEAARGRDDTASSYTRLRTVPGVADATDPDGEQHGSVVFSHVVGGDVQGDGPVRISSLAMSAEGNHLLVADLVDCSVRMIGWPDGRWLRKFGSCGEGPGEFGFILGMAMHSDTIFVLEQTGFWKTLDTLGHELRRTRLQDSSYVPRGVSSFVGLSGGTLSVVSSARLGSASATVDDWGHGVVVIGSNGSRLVPVRVSDAAGHMAATHPTSYHRPVACQSPDFVPGEGGNMVVAHGLAFESVIVDHHLMPVMSTLYQPGWGATRVDSLISQLPQLFGPTRPPAIADRGYLVCGQSFYAVGWRAFSGSDERTDDRYGALEVRRYTGELLVRRVWYGGPDDGQIGGPRLVSGDTLITVVSDSAGNPQLAAWVVGRR